MILPLVTRSLFRSPPPRFSTWASSALAGIPPNHSSGPLHRLFLFAGGSTAQGRNLDYELLLVSALKFCSSFQNISHGREIHCLILKSGFDANLFVQNSLISMYIKCGLLEAARWMFDRCPMLDSVSWNIMVAGYAKLGNLNEARRLFEMIPAKDCVSFTTMVIAFDQNDCWLQAAQCYRSMRGAGLAPNEVTMASVISAYSHVGGLRHCQALHALVAKLGLAGFDFVLANLVRLYCVCSSLRGARILFDESPKRNAVAWNVMLDGYSKGEHVGLAEDLFTRIPSKDVVSWGTMIDCYARAGKLGDALITFRAMGRAGWLPNDVMMVNLISACGRAMAFVEGQQLHGTIMKIAFDGYDFVQSTTIFFYASCRKINLALLQFELGSKDHLTSWNALMSGFMRNGMIPEARQVFDEMPKRDAFSWGTIISGYAQRNQPEAALDIFHRMVADGIQPNEVAMVSALSAIASLGFLKEGIWIHEYICSNSIPLNDTLSAALIDMYAKCGCISRALEFIHQITDNVSSVSPWNAVICGLAMHGHADLCLEMFSRLEKAGIQPNAITFIGVLSACCHAGLVDTGEQYFRSMKRCYGINPNIKHYGCMVDLMGRAGRVEEAEELIRTMPMEADVVIWGTLLAACRSHGKMEIGERVAEHLARLDRLHGGSKVLLSNIYAEAGQWEDVFLVRKAIQSHKILRSSARSGVE